MKVLQVINAVQVINELTSQKMKIATSYKLKKISDEANIIAEKFEASRKELLEKYATLNEDGTQYKFPEDDGKSIKDFNEEIEVFMNEEIEFEVKHINVNELAGIELEAHKAGVIDWFVDFE